MDVAKVQPDALTLLGLEKAFRFAEVNLLRSLDPVGPRSRKRPVVRGI
ncbi:hypothetical protein RISK_002804 [Rhodopirellula islandica]|uniref:Uncharacterized protein n=1 Tax=Rhodopirellula islandica TaxID=595434 RepID=A0A0J1BEM9_RHOIS|nr:hypothetical protein RISK_002804 [Rhodopirellula islandica]